jgi:hypothetical protein
MVLRQRGMFTFNINPLTIEETEKEETVRGYGERQYI